MRSEIKLVKGAAGMADNKKYYYLKLKDNFFDSEEMIILQGMENGYIYSDILLKLYLRSLKNEGRLMFKNLIPYTPEALAMVVRHPVEAVERSLEIFQELELVEVLDNGAIYMMDIQNFIGQSSTEADRVREYRKSINAEKSMACGTGVTDVVQMYNENTPEKEREKEREKEIDIDKERGQSVHYQQIADMYNDTCVSFPRLTRLSDARKKAIRARMKQYSVEDFRKLFQMAEESSFLKGQNARNWSASFDWLIKDTNMAKVLDGNYSDRQEGKGGAADGTQRGSSFRL